MLPTNLTSFLTLTTTAGVIPLPDPNPASTLLPIPDPPITPTIGTATTQAPVGVDKHHRKHSTHTDEDHLLGATVTVPSTSTSRSSTSKPTSRSTSTRKSSGSSTSTSTSKSRSRTSSTTNSSSSSSTRRIPPSTPQPIVITVADRAVDDALVGLTATGTDSVFITIPTTASSE